MKTQREILEQREKNEQYLLDQIEKYSGQPINKETAAWLNMCRGAYKALCMLKKNKEGYHKKSEKITAYVQEHEREAYHDLEHTETHSAEPCRLHLDREMAMLWTRDIINADGTTGPHWSMEKVRQVMDQRGMIPGYDQLQFYAVLNSIYSDYCAVANKYGVNKPEFYIDMAKAWIDDADAAENKAARYFAYIVKH